MEQEVEEAAQALLEEQAARQDVSEHNWRRTPDIKRR
jgi:hypothetical protein